MKRKDAQPRCQGNKWVSPLASCSVPHPLSHLQPFSAASRLAPSLGAWDGGTGGQRQSLAVIQQQHSLSQVKDNVQRAELSGPSFPSQ